MPAGRGAPRILVPLALLVLAAACYARVLPAYFLSDDFCLVGQAAREGFSYGWTRFVRPGAVLSYVADHALWGLEPFGYHLTNVLFHGAAACGVFGIARHFVAQTASPRPALVAFWAAALFVALPSHTEAVSWIAGRTDVIASAFGLAATWCLLTLLEGRTFPLLRATVAIALFAAALLTKECVVALPLVWSLVLAHAHWSKRAARLAHAAGATVASLVVVVLYLFLRRATIGEFVGGYGADGHVPTSPVAAAANLGRFVGRTFLPALPPRLADLELPIALAAAVLPAAALVWTVAAIRSRLRAPPPHLIALLALCFVVCLAPVITLRVHLFDTQGERLLYLPSAFACVLAACVAGAAIPHTRAGAAALAGIVVVQAVALNFVNDRWVTASQLSRRIAQEVAQTDPATTVVLNVPDSYRGAYVFRNGLDEAATTFLGRRTRTPHRVLVTHDVHALDEVFDVRADGAALVLGLPPETDHTLLRHPGFSARAADGSLIVDTHSAEARVRTFLSFRTGGELPMLRTIERPMPR